MEVSLQDVLSAREARVRRQQFLLTKYRTPLLCFTMNIAGPVKTTPLIERGFYAGLELLDSLLPEEKILFRESFVFPTGCEGDYAISMPASELKRLCSDVEDKHPLGRLFDMDVIDTDGTKLERETHRSCMVCGAPGRFCAASRAHSVAHLQTVTNQILMEHFAKLDQDTIASRAVQSLIDEVNTTPKPGLVDQRNNGSHTDMTRLHFLDSANALRCYFAECVKIGRETASFPPQEAFSLLRNAGLKAEKNMYRVTGGINTHKGVIYTMGVLCGSIGRLWRIDAPVADIDSILSQCASLVCDAVEADFATADGSTAGQKLYLEHGLGGIRAEVAAGLPSVAKIGLPCYQNALNNGLSPNDAGVLALLHLIAQVEDTNLYHRGGYTGAAWAAESAQRLLNEQSFPSIQAITQLDDAFVEKNLSPGGCADLLAVTLFLHSLTQHPSCGNDAVVIVQPK